ncbi:hypothetical protein WA538_003231, partial [Blastocystis sp. DL]
MRLAFVILVLSLCEAVCRTYSSDCVSSTKQIQRLALYHDNTRWTNFVIEIIQYNSTDCNTELYRVKYTESVSCYEDPMSQYYLACDTVVESASFYFDSLETMSQFNITCSKKEIGEYVLSSKSSCVCGSKSAISQLDNLIGTSRHYMVNTNQVEGLQIGSLWYHKDENSLCDVEKESIWPLVICILCILCISIALITCLVCTKRRQSIPVPVDDKKE